LLTKSGKVYKGCNIENGAFSPTNCAERTAVFTAVADGEKEFVAIAVVGGADEIKNFCPPCGVCRQVLSEFCKEDFEIHLFNGEEIKTFTLGELLPESFNL
jgi:cytidine deaminase